jgi:hypothetical protein
VLNHPSHSARSAEPETLETEPIDTPRSWQAELGKLLTRAAALCVEHDIEVESFMKTAWSAYVEARPGMRDYLEEMQLRDQLEEIRQAGRMGKA